MKINLDQEFKALNGETMKSTDGSVTLRSICTEALLNVTPEEKLTGEEKAKRYKLANDIFNSKDEDFEMQIEDVALLKRLVGELFTPIIVGQAFSFFEK